MSGQVWLISDTHFGHESLLKFRNERHGFNFKDTTDMNLHIVQNINNNIRSKDSVWHFGDVDFCRWDTTLSYLRMTTGHWKLVMGNHDTKQVSDYLQFFKRIVGARKLKGFMMTHIPIHPNELAYRSWPYNVHGHIHHKERNLPEDKYYNVNIDVNNLMPTPIEDVLKRWGLPHGG